MASPSSERPWIRALGLSRRPKSARRGRTERTTPRVAVELLEGRTLLASNWTAVTAAPVALGTMMLLTDGTVIAQGSGPGHTTANWYKLSPDSHGNYSDGTWSQIGSMNVSRLYFASNVLQNGNVFLAGGEYTGNNSETDTNTAEIYNSTLNSWSNIAPFPQNDFGDDPSILLSNGNVLTGYILGPQTYIYNIANNSWSQTGTKLDNDQSDEEGFVKLPDDSILSYNVFYNNGLAARPASGGQRRYQDPTQRRTRGWTPAPVPVAAFEQCRRRGAWSWHLASQRQRLPGRREQQHCDLQPHLGHVDPGSHHPQWPDRVRRPGGLAP